MSEDLVNIEVNGVALKARKGQMIMQVTDSADIYIPRFCYHEKLTIAANCRMCLVEVERSPKPLPACATPVVEGMKVFTKSPRAVAAQKATMEFLLINHPLDCPICDQGGECELQDLALGFGRDISRFNERKRVVKDKNLGPLISTDMTRCIHCTRCVRFGQEIQGYPELGTTGRGELMQITTYVEHGIDHELSANIIDLCPVGALNNKPFRYHARAWEMAQHALISPHDGFGTNLFAHVLRGTCHAHGAATQRADQRDLDRRPRSVRIRGHVCGRPRDSADAADRRQAPGRRLGSGADRRRRGLEQDPVGARRRRRGIPGIADVDRRGAVFARANGARLTAPAMSIIACGSWISGVRRAKAAFPGSAWRLRRSSASKACWSSVRTCGTRCRCSRIGSARRPSRPARRSPS